MSTADPTTYELAGPAPARTPLEWARVLVAPVYLTLAVAGMARLVTTSPELAGAGMSAWASALGVLLVAVFNLLVVRAYILRHRARATTSSRVARVVAVVASGLPILLLLIVGQTPQAGLAVASDVLLLGGTAWSVWCLHTLGRSFSVVAQARAVVSAGPYRWVRHPLYTGEVAAMLGLALRHPTAAALGVWALLVALQVYRAVQEERVLADALPGYADYRRRTAMLLPGLI